MVITDKNTIIDTMVEQIIFSNEYDNRVHFAGVSTVGVKFVGPIGLLGELELKAGLTRVESEPYVRYGAYKEALKSYLAKTPKSVFAASAEKNMDSVAKMILRWRDNLVMAGWESSITIDSPVLKEIAEIETHFTKSPYYQGVSDRWLIVLDYFRENNLCDAKIEVINERNQLHPTIGAILDAINARQPDTVRYNPKTPAKKQKVSAYQFEELNDALLTAAVTLDPEKDVIICQDTKAFNNFLNLTGKRNVTSKLKNCNAPVLQLFKLLLLLLAEPKNIYNIVTYLKTSPCPVKGGNRLASYLMQKCGWGSDAEWKDYLAKYEEPDNEKKQQVAEIHKNFKDKMTSCYTQDLTFGIVKEAVSELKTWAIRQKTAAASAKIEYELSDAQKEELSTLVGFCKKFEAIDRNDSDVLTSVELIGYADEIYDDGEYDDYEAVVGAFDTYPSLACVHTPNTVGKVVWVDCYGDLLASYDYEFLNEKEKSTLCQQGVRVWSRSEQVAAQIASLTAFAQSCGTELLLFTPKRVHGEIVASSPLLSCLSAVPELPQFDLGGTMEGIIQLPKPQPYYTLNKPITSHRKSRSGGKVKESYSSLDLLVKSPFDYVMKYLAGLYAPNLNNLEGMQRIKGTVGHKCLENICAECKNNVAGINTIVNNAKQFSARVDAAAHQVGMVLLLKENRIEFDRFKSQLQHSFINLLDIIIQNNLTIVGLEAEYTEDASDITDNNASLEAKVDLVLSDAEGGIYIFDLKFSVPKSYMDTLKTNKGKVLQLDVYKYCIEKSGKRVVFRGYFMLTDGRLYTTDRCLKDNNNITVVSPEKNSLSGDIMEKLHNSYSYRYKELANRILEEGEGQSCDGVSYYESVDDKDLYPYDIDTPKKEPKKAENKYSDYKIFKGGLK